MAVNAEQIIPTITPYLNQILGLIWIIVKLLGVLAVAGYGYILVTYNTRVMVDDYLKGKRSISKLIWAKEVKNKQLDSPQIMLFDKFGLGGTRINQPPSECIVPYKSMFAKKLYKFVKKDGLYYPVSNMVLGYRYEIPPNQIKAKEAIDQLKVRDNLTVGDNIVYSIEGSGLEISRDYDAEQGIWNNLETKATKYRNKKPIEIAAMYGLMIVVIVGSVVIMVYGLKQFGNIADAVYGLQQPLKDGISQAISNRIGPG